MRSLVVVSVVLAGCMSLAQPKPPERPWKSKDEDCAESYGYTGAAAAIAATALGVGWVLWSTDAPQPDEGFHIHVERGIAIPLFIVGGIEGLDTIFTASATGDCREYHRFADRP